MNLADRLERIPEGASRWFGTRRPHELPFTLTQGRIYVLPSGAGFGFALALLVMLIGAINYNLSLGYGLVFLLAGLGVVATVQAFRNLLGLRVLRMHAEPTFAGQAARLRVTLENPSHLRRPAVSLRCADVQTHADLDTASVATLELALPTMRRGWLVVPPLRLGTTWPLGLVRVWSVFRPEVSCLVYPAPETDPPSLPAGGDAAGETTTLRAGDDDFAGLRPHRITDSPRHIAWKAAASGRPLLTKEFAAQQGARVLLDWSTLHGLDDDARAARLTAWVLAAEARGLQYALRTPDGTQEAGSGALHMRACLARLALAHSRHDQT